MWTWLIAHWHWMLILIIGLFGVPFLAVVGAAWVHDMGRNDEMHALRHQIETERLRQELADLKAKGRAKDGS